MEVLLFSDETFDELQTRFRLSKFDRYQSVVKPRVAPRAARRPRGKARRGSILGIFDRGATPSTRDASPLECSGDFATGWYVSRDARLLFLAQLEAAN